MRYLTIFGCATAMVLSLHGAASAKGLTIDQLKTLVKDLGYAAESDDKSYVRITEQGKWDNSIFLAFQDQGESLEIYSNLGPIPDDGKKIVPYAEMLNANDESPYYFSLGRADGKPTVFQEARIPASTINKQSLRKIIDAWIVRIDMTEPIWGQDHWAAVASPTAPVPPTPATPPATTTAPSATAAPLATQIFCSPSVEKAPLTIQSATFRSGPADAEGGKIVRPLSVFTSEENIYIVLEIKGFQCNNIDKDKYQSLFTINQDIKLDSDKDYEPFLSLSKTLDFDMSAKIDTAFIDLTLTPHWHIFGSYSFRYTVRDNVSGREASIVLPLSVSAPK